MRSVDASAHLGGDLGAISAVTSAPPRDRRCGGELPHLISDAATMQIIRWTDGGFGMAAHNYDGDMLTDEVAQVHRSPGFITSNLIGKAADGSMIKE